VTRRLVAAIILLASPGATLPAWGAALLPELQWEPRSDWVNVRTDAAPRAVGDGQADDTAALQAALATLSDQPGKRNTVYLPAGTYRITKTLALSKVDGIALIGHGRGTRIVWDGPADTTDASRMFWSNGLPRSRYVGITWDGNRKAHVGFDHDSQSLFETENDHQFEAFLNFTGSGVRVGHNQAKAPAQATAETTLTHCLFQNCDRGIAVLTFNDYNFTMAGCDFLDCGTGVYGGKGSNFYVRDSHFERSQVTDVRAYAEHACSVRRCTSIGSRLFIEQNSIAPLTVQDCQVSGWTNPTGAVTLGGGPVIVFDCVFTNPPARHAPVTLARGQRLVLSNNRSADTDGLVKPGSSDHVTDVPAGKLGGSLTSARQRFRTENADVAGKVFDARRDFGAKADGKTDDAPAVQAAIEAARQHGKGAVAYLPSGDYAIGRTLRVTGKDYRFAGSGTHTRLLWQGPQDGVMVDVRDPENVTVENLNIGEAGNQKNAVDILQTGSGVPSSVHYERVWVYGMYRKQPFTKGLRGRDLPKGTVIRADHFNGNLRFTNSSRATLLFNASYEGAIVVEGKAESTRDGILGFLTRLATINLHGLYVRDSQNITMSDYYVESADRLMEFRGSPGDPEGRVTLGMPKTHCSQNPVIGIENYHGRIAIGPSMFYPGGITPAEVTQKGANPLTLVLMACQAYDVTPAFRLDTGAKCVLLENTGKGMGGNILPPGGLAAVADALDDLRRLGALDLAINFNLTVDGGGTVHGAK
jgi:hypothetical protein